MPRILTTTPIDDSPPLPPMLSYESSASSSSSSSPPSPYALRHRLRRKRSPSPSSRHVSQPYSGSRHFITSSRAYSPSSREADVACLLDPTYASPAPFSPLKSSKTQLREVYVDHHGDLHDPDFRHFPVLSHIHMHSQPQWEHGYRIAEDSDDEEEEEAEQRRSSFEAQRRRPSSSINFHPSPVHFPYDEPASYESRFLAEDDEDLADHHEQAPLKEKHFYLCSKSAETSRKSHHEKQSPNEGDQVIQADSDWTPTCTQNLRRQWQAIALSFRFSLFRTKQRLRRHLTG